jgi:hypothetical protein
MQTSGTFDAFLAGHIPGASPVFQGFQLLLAQNVSPVVGTKYKHSKHMARLAGMK